MLQIHNIPIYSDNYVWVLASEQDAWVIDPGDHAPVLEFLQQNQLHLRAVLLTHRHWDHVTGVQPLVDALGGTAPVYGPHSDSIRDMVTHPVAESDTINLGPLQAQVWEIPGHTLDHIGFYLPEQGALFCGDTLFACGCGKLFDGTMSQLFTSLRRIATLPSATRVYCTHEYTLANIKFALLADPQNQALQARQRHCQALRQQNQPTLPTTIELELATNPFLRCAQDSVQRALKKHTGVHTADEFSYFEALRHWKNRY